MKKLLSILLMAILLFIPSVPTLAASDYQGSQKEAQLVKLIASGDDYLVEGGIPFESWDEISVQWESGGKNHTHQYLTSRALTILQADKGKKTAATLTAYSSTLLAGSDWPDTYEKDGLFNMYEGHFYDPRDGESWTGSTTNTALTRFRQHSLAAVSNYNTNRTLSMQELGRALHYLADINEPHHAANLTALNSNHSSFETFADNTRTNYAVKTSTKYTTYTTWDAYCTEIISKSAWFALDYVDEATSSSSTVEAIAAKATMGNAQEIMAAYLYNFLKEVKAI